MLSPEKLVTMFVDIVSKNGNLLLDIGPRADGSISQLQLSRVRELGKWLRINGEGIYGTRPWVRSEGKAGELPVRFTRKGDALYAIILGKPATREIVLESLQVRAGTRVQMLGSGGDLGTSAAGGNFHVSLPAELPGDYAYTLKILPQPI
jgi:alpha-L-fucosidase